MTNAVGEYDERHRLTAVQGLAALSLDALSSVAYGPEAILIVLVAAGAAGLRYSLPVTGAIIVLLTALVVSYRQVIEAFPNGGGAYAEGVGLPAVQPARRDPGPGDQAGHGQCGAVPPALPAGAVRPHPSEGAAPPVTK